MDNIVIQDIASFLAQYSPFNSLAGPQLEELAATVRIRYLLKNRALFNGGDAMQPYLYVLRQGKIGLSVTSDAEETFFDKCDEGDILGLRPFFAKNNYLMTARAQEECILYAIPLDFFKGFIIANSTLLDFFLESFASQTRNPHDKDHSGKLISENMMSGEQIADIQYFQPIKYTRNPITANTDDVLMHIAKTMANSNIGSVIIQDDNQLPVGIITDQNLRAKIATGQFPVTVEARHVMTSPVITVPENISVAEAQILMLKHNVGHLCVTRDGSSQAPVTGIISEHDVVAAQANTPGVLLKQSRKAMNEKDLRHVREKLTDLVQNLVEKNIPIPYISGIVAEINIAITKRAIELAVEKTGTLPPVRFVWVNVGAQGRKEQILAVSQDNALIFEDVDAAQHATVKRYFTELAELVNAYLNTIGYSYSTLNIMAKNPDWCKSLSDWLKQFSIWINQPAEQHIEVSAAFFDFDFIYGPPFLEDAFTDAIVKNTDRNKKFFAYLAADALRNPPPLGFFRQILVENDGQYKDAFDIVARAMDPLADAARVLALSHGLIEITNTYQRFKNLMQLEATHAELFEQCAEAYITLQHFKTEAGLKNNSDGRYIQLNELTKADRAKLKKCFQPIGELQDIIKNRFSLSLIS